MKKSILILSGGLDSTVSSWVEKKEKHSEPILALTFDYGQKASRREQESARKIADHLGVRHHVMTLPWLKEITGTALVNPNQKMPQILEGDLNDLRKSQETAQAVWVPNRNGVFLNIAAAYAESLDADHVVTGFNLEEGATFPDNSEAFVSASDVFFQYATLRKIRVVSHTLKWNKKEIALKAAELKISIRDLWFCYEGGQSPCRCCESCLRDLRAFREAGIEDPWR